MARAVSHRSGIEVMGMAAALFWDSSAPPAFAWASSVRPLTHTTEQNLWDAPSAAFPLLQLLARVAGEGADGWSLSLRRIAVAAPCGHGFGTLRFILKVYRLSVLRFLVNSCTVLYGLCTGEKKKIVLMTLPLTILEIKTSYNVLWKCES